MPEIERTKLSEVLQIGTVDAGNDTLFAKAQKSEFSKTHLTLVVGVGGSGATAITEAINTASQKLETGFQQYVKFILLDSATNEIERIQKLIGHENLIIINSSEAGAADNLRPEVRPDFYKKMIPADYDITRLADLNGSGQSRLTGRIKFYYDKNGSYVDTILRDTIAGFYKGDWAQHASLPVDVMILAGLSGGTGSGTFADVAAHVRYALRHANQNVAARVFGYLFLSDTVTEWEPDANKRNTLHANCYAALKELEAFMSISAMPEAKVSFSSRDNATRFDVDALHMLYDYPVLINGSYRESKTMMAECIVNMIASSTGRFDQNSFYSNTPQARAAFLNDPNNYADGLLKPDFRPEDSHRYAGIGYAYAAIPEKIITSNVVSVVCRKLYETDPLHPEYKFCSEDNAHRMSKTEMEKEIRTLFGLNDKQITPATYWDQKLKGELEKLSRLGGNSVEITAKEVRLGQTNTYVRGFKAEEKLTKAKEEMQAHLLGLKRAFEDGMYTVMYHFGPKAIEYLYSGKGPNDKEGHPQIYSDISIEEMLSHCRTELKKIIGDSAKNKLPDNKIPTNLVEVVAKTKLGEWKSAYQSALEYQNKQKLAESMLEPGGIWETIIEKPIRAYVDNCSIFAGRIEQLNDFYHSQGSSLESADYQTFVNAAKVDNCVNLCSDGNVYQWVQEQVKQKINAITIDDLKRAFVDSFKADPSVWISDVPGKTRKEYDRVVASVCKVGRFSQPGAIELNATAYFNHVLSAVSPESLQNKADEIVAGIVAQLITKSKPSIKVNQNGNRVVNRFALLPQSLQGSPYSEAIVNAFRNAWNNNSGAGNTANEIAFSPAVSDIVCYQTSVANGLCDLIDIDLMERCYYYANDPTIHLVDGQYDTVFREKTKTELLSKAAATNGQQMQAATLKDAEDLLFGTGLSLKHYPSVGTACTGLEQEYMEHVFKPIVDYALQEKLIEVKPRTNGTSPYDYEFLMRIIPDDWSLLDVSGYKQTDSTGKLARGQELFAYLKQQNALSQKAAEVRLALKGSVAFEDGFDFTVAKSAGDGKGEEIIRDLALSYMARVLRRNTYWYKRLRETISRYYDIDRELKKVEEPLKYRAKAQHFTNFLLHGAIAFEEDRWMYLLDEKGTKAAFCSFDYGAVYNLKELEKKLLNDGLGFLIAAMKYDSINVDLDRIIRNRMLDEGEVMKQLADNNRTLVKDFAAEIEKIQAKFPNRGLEDAFRKTYELGENDYEYVALLTALKEEFEKALSQNSVRTLGQPAVSAVESENIGRTWDCLNCGRKGILSTDRFCPSCGTKKPESQMTGNWDCPSCGRKGLSLTDKFCPGCGTKKPEPQMTGNWECQSCGKKGLSMNDRFCPECGTPRLGLNR